MGRARGPAASAVPGDGQSFVRREPDRDDELEDREDEELDRLDELARPAEDDPPDLTELDERPAEEPPERGAL